jgi:ring-1,2-phenylacetyl-CoA epoxidase subunit PaaD
MVMDDSIPIRQIRALLEEVNDPEVPVLSIVDLGIVRDVRTTQGALQGGAGGVDGAGGAGIEIVITPTYSGCPAMDAIRMNIRMLLLQHGFGKAVITTILSPAWTTDWMSQKGKDKLKAYGIAPPMHTQQVCHPALFQEEEAIPCPRCNSYHTQLISQFGSTACKALYRCEDCREPFDYFKCH